MSISSIGAQSALIMKQLVQMRAQFDDLQRQLATGHKSATYAGLGIDRGVTVSLNSQLSAISSFDDTNQNVMARIAGPRIEQGKQLIERIQPSLLGHFGAAAVADAVRLHQCRLLSRRSTTS